MSDLDDDLRGLRDELTAAIPLPDVHAVTGRARARRRTQLGAIVAVIVVALAVPVLRGMDTNTRPAAKEPPNTSYVLDFADPDNGYALVRHCPPGRSGCAFTLYGSTDGGRTWEKRSLPPALDPKTGYFNATMYVLGPDAVAIDRPKAADSDRIYSGDGGRTWHRNPKLYNGTTTAPLSKEAALMMTRCGEQPYSKIGPCAEFGTIRPDTGQFVVAPAQPSVVPDQLGPVAAMSGRFWVIGRTTEFGDLAIALTEDGGRTWSTSALNDPTIVADPGGWSVVELDGVMYVLASAANELEGVWRGQDGDWRLVWARSAHLGEVLPGLIGSPVVTEDGSLLLSDGKHVWESTDQGRTFSRTQDEPFSVKWTRGGYLRLNVGRFALSSDGVHWRGFQVP